MHKISLFLGGFFGTTAIILGAFGAHFLKKIFTAELLNSFETGVRYQFYHALALILLGMYAKLSGQSVSLIATLMSMGVIFFSGSIYILCLMKANDQVGLKGLGIITPIGGVLLIAAWTIWLVQMARQSS